MLNDKLALRIAGVLIVLNAVLTGWIAASHLEPFADLATYYEAAQNIAQGKGYSLDIKIVANATRTDAPFPVGDRFLYPLIVAAAIKLFGDSLAIANVVSAVSMSLVALPLFFLGRALFDWRTGLVAVALFTLNPFYHAIGIGGWTDLTATLFYYGCLACVVQTVLGRQAVRQQGGRVWLAAAHRLDVRAGGADARRRDRAGARAGLRVVGARAQHSRWIGVHGVSGVCLRAAWRVPVAEFWLAAV